MLKELLINTVKGVYCYLCNDGLLSPNKEFNSKDFDFHVIKVFYFMRDFQIRYIDNSAYLIIWNRHSIKTSTNNFLKSLLYGNRTNSTRIPSRTCICMN